MELLLHFALNRVATAYDSGARAEYSFNKDNLLIGLYFNIMSDRKVAEVIETDTKGENMSMYESESIELKKSIRLK